MIDSLHRDRTDVTADVTPTVRRGGIEVAAEGDGSRVALWGEVDVTLRDEAGAAMTEVVLRGGPVVVDASRLDFLDSTGLAFVIQLGNAAEEAGASLVLRDPPASMLTLLDVIGLHGRIPVEETAARR